MTIVVGYGIVLVYASPLDKVSSIIECLHKIRLAAVTVIAARRSVHHPTAFCSMYFQ
jgi:hypothetical protein